MKITLSLLCLVSGLLPVLDAFAGDVDFPEVGKSYRILLVPSDDAHGQVSLPEGAQRSSVKILARANNGWCFVEYGFGGYTEAGRTATERIWINFNQVIAAKEDEPRQTTPSSLKPPQSRDSTTLDPAQELEELDTHVGHTLTAEQKAQARVIFEEIAVRERAEDSEGTKDYYRRLGLLLTPEQTATRWVHGLDEEVSLTPEQKKQAHEILLAQARVRRAADLENRFCRADEIQPFQEQIRALLRPAQREIKDELNRKIEFESISTDKELAIVAERFLRSSPVVAAKVSKITGIIPGEASDSHDLWGESGEAIFVVEGPTGIESWVGFTFVWKRKSSSAKIEIVRVIDNKSRQVIWPTPAAKN